MSSPASFLGGAKDRLLPASIPFRFFASACLFHILAWFVLLVGAKNLPEFTGEPGPILAALHLLTLGVLVTTVMGASYQLLPVATLNPLTRIWPTRLSFWFIVPGTLLLTSGMIEANPILLYTGAILVVTALALFAFLAIENFRRAGKAMPVVIAHGWASLAALVGLAGLGLVLITDFSSGFLSDRQTIAQTHMILAVFGFMGLLTFGFSHILIPMFVLSRALPKRQSRIQFLLAVTAVAFAIFAMVFQNQILVTIAIILGLSASIVYVLLMYQAFKTAMRKRIGLSFILIKLSWVFLISGLLIGLAIALGFDIPNGTTLFGFIIIVGWLLTFLTGILQRIMPFLASMHAAGKGGMPPLLSELTADTPLKIHAICHITALVLCSIGIVTENISLVTTGATSGLIGAVSFTVFAALVIRKLKTGSNQLT